MYVSGPSRTCHSADPTTRDMLAVPDPTVLFGPSHALAAVI